MHNEHVVRQNEPAATVLAYSELQVAYDFFNRELFDGRLPPALITLSRAHKNAKGYYWGERFARRDGEEVIDEIALNPSTLTMLDRDDRDILSTLVHEMTHLEQKHFGKAPKGGYHDVAWGKLMDAVGLEPTSTGAAGGKRTGTKVTHMIVDGGRFDVACAKLLKDGFVIPYMDRKFSDAEQERAKKKTQSKTKFCCPTCDAAAWGKPTLQVVCGDCEEVMEPEIK